MWKPRPMIFKRNAYFRPIQQSPYPLSLGRTHPMKEAKEIRRAHHFPQITNGHLFGYAFWHHHLKQTPRCDHSSFFWSAASIKGVPCSQKTRHDVIYCSERIDRVVGERSLDERSGKIQYPEA